LPPGSLKILHLTDCHLYADPSQCLLGLNTLETLDLVISHAQQRMGRPDLVLATGDLVHDASDAGYKRLRARLSQIGAPAYCLPGNHDIPDKMARLLNQDNVHYVPHVQINDWSLIFLDSTVPGETGGTLSERELALLEEKISSHREMNTLICLHHQPISIGSQWIDQIGLSNSEPLLQRLQGQDQIKGMIWGHIHQEFESRHENIRLMGTPSTCVQFIPEQDEFGIDVRPPGYRWLNLLPNGEIHSQVELLAEMPTGLDLASMGY
jgi:Icc protein